MFCNEEKLSWRKNFTAHDRMFFSSSENFDSKNECVQGTNVRKNFYYLIKNIQQKEKAGKAFVENVCKRRWKKEARNVNIFHFCTLAGLRTFSSPFSDEKLWTKLLLSGSHKAYISRESQHVTSQSRAENYFCFLFLLSICELISLAFFIFGITINFHYFAIHKHSSEAIWWRNWL